MTSFYPWYWLCFRRRRRRRNAP